MKAFPVRVLRRLARLNGTIGSDWVPRADIPNPRVQRMTLEDFEESLSANEPPVRPRLPVFGGTREATGHALIGCVQQAKEIDGSWVRAYLRRKEERSPMPRAGTVGRLSPFPNNHRRKNGSAS